MQRALYGTLATRADPSMPVEHEESMETSRDGAIVGVHHLDTRTVQRQIANERRKVAHATKEKERRAKRDKERKEAAVG